MVNSNIKLSPLEEFIADFKGLTKGTIVEIGVLKSSSDNIKSIVRDLTFTHFLYASIPEWG